MSAVKVQKVKVSPYPIAATIFGTTAPIKGNIVKVTMTGFLVEVPVNPFVAAEKYEVQFVLPVIGVDFKESVVVIKSYDKFQGKDDKGLHTYKLIEFHFRNMNGSKKQELENFLRQIGQLR